MKFLTLILALSACSSPAAPRAAHCLAEKTAAYADHFNGAALPPGWSSSDVWRLDPVTTLYFNSDCSQTITAPSGWQGPQ